MSKVNAMSNQHTLLPEEIVGLETVSEVQMSPDGKKVAFVASTISKRDGVDRNSIWLANIGKYSYPLHTPYTSLQEPRWSPNGEYLAFLSMENKNKRLCFTNPKGALLSEMEIFKGANSIEWSPDGRFISFLCGESKNSATNEVQTRAYEASHLYVIEKTTGMIHQILKGDIRVMKYAWSPDSQQLVVSIMNDQNNTMNQELIILNLHNEKRHFLSKTHDTTIMLAWSPDGKYIAWCGREHEPGSGQMMIISLEEQHNFIPRTICADFPGSVKWIGFLPDGRVIFAALKNFRVGIYTVMTDGSKIEILLDPNETKPGSLGSGSFTNFSISLSSDGQIFATTRSGPKEPGNVVVGEWGKQLQRITNFNRQVKEMNLGETEELSWFSKDGLEINGFLIKPVDYIPGKRYPTIVEIHGGPRRSWWDTCYVTNSWAQLLANNGYMVLLPNPRGSSGRGAEFVRENNQDLGGKDFTDIMSGVDHIIQLGYADADRLGVAGWSYGGYLTSWAITQTNSFKVAVMGASIVNFISWQGQSSMASAWSAIHWREPLIAYHHPEQIIKRSPINFVKNIKAPTLILHGANDKKIPSNQSDEFYVALKALGIPVEYMKYPSEGHVILKEVHQIDKMKRIVNWLDQHLKK